MAALFQFQTLSLILFQIFFGLASANEEALLSLKEEELQVDNKVSQTVMIGIAIGIIIFFTASGVGGYLIQVSVEDKESITTGLSLSYTSNSKKILLVKQISRGAFGVVWEGEYCGEKVAVKCISADGDKNPKKQVHKTAISKMMVSEAVTMEQMTHPRIVQFIYFESESLSIVLELMPVGSLSSYIRATVTGRKEMPWKTRHQLMIDICEGMAFLHAKTYPDGTEKRKVLHQDLKSANVLLKFEHDELRAKIADFGLSTLAETLNSQKASSLSTHVDVKGGTKAYQAPELFKKNATFSRRCDVFAGGVIFLELVTLMPPKGLYDRLCPGIFENPGIPNVLRQVFRMSLHEKSTERFNFNEIQKVLESEEGGKIAQIKEALDVDMSVSSRNTTSSM